MWGLACYPHVEKTCMTASFQYEISLAYRFLYVSVPSQESARSCICVLGIIDFASFCYFSTEFWILSNSDLPRFVVPFRILYCYRFLPLLSVNQVPE